MANGYVDLGTYVGITPYVGAGAGIHLSELERPERHHILRRRRRGPAPPSAAVGGTSRGGEDGWSFTYALMAGVAYDLTQNFKLDVGYKYRNIDGGDMFGWDSPQTFGDGSHGNIETHEVRLGLRYELW